MNKTLDEIAEELAQSLNTGKCLDLEGAIFDDFTWEIKTALQEAVEAARTAGVAEGLTVAANISAGFKGVDQIRREIEEAEQEAIRQRGEG